MKNININVTLKELKEYNEMSKTLEVEIKKLQEEAKEYMTENGMDEVISCDGIKATYRDVISNRFDGTQLKKDHLDLYNEYLKKTTYKRFTCN